MKFLLGGIFWLLLSAGGLVFSIVNGDFSIEMIIGIVITLILGIAFLWASKNI